MIPRKQIDISWKDLLYTLIVAIFPLRSRKKIVANLESLWTYGDNVAVLSVRSGFDMLLTALDLPQGSEVIVSAITIPDMIRILRKHELVPVPIDLDIESLSVKEELLEKVCTERTRAILIAHLFGTRMPLENVVEFSKKHNLFLIEDCAQAFTGDDWLGHHESDVALFSFGPIKTATALGGGVLHFNEKNHDISRKVRQIQETFPKQKRIQYIQRVSKYFFMKLLSVPFFYGILVRICDSGGVTHDDMLQKYVRGFNGENFFYLIRHQPCTPLLRLLARRLKKTLVGHTRPRVKIAQRAERELSMLSSLGSDAIFNSYWLLPVRHPNADEIIRKLWKNNVDATRGASSLIVVKPPKHHAENYPKSASSAFNDMFFLPIHELVSYAEINDLLIEHSLETHCPKTTIFPH